MNELALFAGAGGGILGGKLLGWRTVCAVENNEHARNVLIARQNDGCLETFPIWDDVRTFDGKLWRGIVDVVSGGFPCQDISCAGKGAGITGPQSGLWFEMARIISEVQPRYCLVENSPMLTIRGLDRVLFDFAKVGYDAEWGVIGAYHVGAPHKRSRIWILAYSKGERCGKTGKIQFGKPKKRTTSRGKTIPYSEETKCELSRKAWSRRNRFADVRTNVSNPSIKRLEGKTRKELQKQKFNNYDWWSIEPQLGRVAHGVAHRVDRIKAIGNGQVPAVVRAAWEILSKR